MADMQIFPETVEEFMEQYKMIDTEKVYSNGIEYVPIFRMEQWFEHERAEHLKMNNVIRRADVLRLIYDRAYDLRNPTQQNLFANAVRNLPSAYQEEEDEIEAEEAILEESMKEKGNTMYMFRGLTDFRDFFDFEEEEK